MPYNVKLYIRLLIFIVLYFLHSTLISYRRSFDTFYHSFAQAIISDIFLTSASKMTPG